MGFGLGDLLRAGVLFLNSVAVLNEERFLKKREIQSPEKVYVQMTTPMRSLTPPLMGNKFSWKNSRTMNKQLLPKGGTRQSKRYDHSSGIILPGLTGRWFPPAACRFLFFSALRIGA